MVVNKVKKSLSLQGLSGAGENRRRGGGAFPTIEMDGLENGLCGLLDRGNHGGGKSRRKEPRDAHEHVGGMQKKADHHEEENYQRGPEKKRGVQNVTRKVGKS